MKRKREAMELGAAQTASMAADLQATGTQIESRLIVDEDGAIDRQVDVSDYCISDPKL